MSACNDRRPAVALLFAALTCGPAFAAWSPQVSPTAQELLDVSFFSTTLGYATGKTGGVSSIIKTTDGVNWIVLPSTPALEFHGIAAVSASVVYAVGTGGNIYKSIDGGASWTPQTSGTPNPLEEVDFVDPLTGWVVGASGTILHTTDGGVNWNPQPSGTGVTLFGVAFADAANGWAVGAGGTILNTVNGGTTWAPQTSGVTTDLFNVSAPSSSVVYAVGKSGTILKTINGGASWSSLTPPTSRDLNDVAFPTTSTGYVVGKNGTILKTIDSGASWDLQCSATGQELHGVDAPTTLIAYAVGKSGTIVKTTDGGFFAGADISGVVFEDADFSGTPSDYDGGAIDLGLDKVDVELYDATDTLVTAQTTAADGTFSFACVADGDYKVRARSATIGDNNTLPKDGFNVACAIQDPATGFACALAELTWADGAALLGGQDANVDDTATDDDDGPGDTYTDVTVAGTDLTAVNFGFAYYPIVKTGDGGQGSLRQAIRNANVIVGAATVLVPAGTFSLALTGAGEDAAVTGDLDITEDLTVSGLDVSSTVIDGLSADRLFDVQLGAVTTISNLTIRNGDAGSDDGGGIRNRQSLILNGVLLTGNTNLNEGGAIWSEGGATALSVTDSDLENNSAKNGGAVFHKGTSGAVSFVDVTLRNNTATTNGGGIHCDGCNGVTTIDGVTFEGNQADHGGGLFFKSSSTPLITNTTVSGNSATNKGGGLRIESGAITLTNVTLAGNSAPAGNGGGIHQSGGTVQLRNTIVAGSPTGGDCSGTLAPLAFNLDGDGTCGFALTADPQLGPLADNGGSTETHALLFGSPAIDAVSAGCPPPATDQRGVARPIDGDGDLTATCDIGAYEAATPTTVSGTVYEDVDGDAGLGDAVAAGNVRVRLYEDVNDNGQVDAGDTFVGETTTNATTGVYSFGVGVGTQFLVAVDSKTVPPSDGLSGGFAQTDVWAEQTYGDDPGTPALDVAARVGGRAAGTSDDVDAASTDPADNAYQHLARVDVSGGSVSGVDFAFSFRAVTHEGDSDDDLTANRTAQGSLRQLIQNANAIVGAPTLAIPGGTYTLTLTGDGEDGALTGDLDVTDDVTLAGASPFATVIDGNRTDRVFDVFAATAQFSDLTVEKGDSQGDHGGGILINSGSTLTLVDTMIRDNDGDRGGGIRVEGDLVASGSTLYGNRGSQGGAIQTSGSTMSVTLTNVTISGNDATSRGGGLELDLTTLTNVTVTGNTSPDGGGIYRRGGNVFTVKNSIIAGNPTGGDCSNVFTSAGYNLDGDGSCALSGPGDMSSGTANLGLLGNNGGSTLTHALLAGSDAFDAVLAGCPPPATDQRGVGRPLGVRCDIGAYEGVTVELGGNVAEDVDGDSNLADAVAVAGVTVDLYLDDGDDLPNAPDTALTSTTTDVNGDYSFNVSQDTTYWIVVDSTDVVPAAGINVPFTAGHAWAEQTYGPVRAWCADGGGGSAERASAGPCYAGRLAATSDDAAALTTAEHIARVPVAASDVSGIDFAFSFEVFTNTVAAVEPAVDTRSAQGSFDQALANANARVGADSLRFVPALAPDDGSGSWWRIDYTAATAALESVYDLGTVIDGTAYCAWDDGTQGCAATATTRDTNTAGIGVNLAVGRSGSFTTPQLDPELEIINEGLRVSQTQAGLVPNGAEIRNLSIHGDTIPIHVETGAASLTGIVVEDNVIGSPPNSFTEPATLPEWGMRIDAATACQIRDNLVGFVQRSNILLATTSSGCTVTRNEVRGGGKTFNTFDGVLVWAAPSTVEGNLITDQQGFGIDTISSGGGHTLRENTVDTSGQGGVQTGGLRLIGGSNVVEDNVIENNSGAGVVVPGDPSVSTLNRISENEFGGNGGPAIDLVAGSGNNNTGDGITLNDGTQLGDGTAGNACGTLATSGNAGLDFPIIDTVILNGDVTGRACAGSEVEIYRASAGAGDSFGGSDYGEGIALLGSTTANGSGDFSLNVGGLSPGDELTAIAIDASDNSSEFAANVAVQPLQIVKRAFQADGTPIASGSTLPADMPVKFLLYVSNPGPLVADLSMRDLLDPLFLYLPGSIRYDNSVASCVGSPCTPGEEAAIFAAADAGTVGSDAVDGDAVSFAGVTLDIGNQTVANAQLDIAADKVWAVVFTIRMQ